jgi:hypothetical protein
MPGGLLNISSEGNANVILTGNPTKTFFKVTYSKYTNFGLQKFRLDFDGLRDLRLTEESKYTFKIKRYADLLMDTYLVINLPDIWSPIYPPTSETGNQWAPYEFRWIKNIGAQIINEIEITCGSAVLQRYSGEYILSMVERDFSAEKKELFDRMTGNIKELNDPANWEERTGTYPYKAHTYPSAYYTTASAGAEPSIRGRTLYIPINAWFTLDCRCAFPLASLQYNELIINITLRPIQEMFQIRDVFDPTNKFPYIQPDFNVEQFKPYYFLQTPPGTNIDDSDVYENKTSTWKADVHLLSTYCFLTKEEQKLFASQDQIYLVKDIFEYSFLNITSSNRVKLTSSSGLVSNWMFFLQRNDVNQRNEWSNYTNWAYEDRIPSNIDIGPYATILNNQVVNGPGLSNLYVTGDYAPANNRDILETFGIVIDGDYREYTFPKGLYDFVEKYTRTQGSAKDGLYCYNFCLNTSPFEYQPSGALNMGRFKNVEFEFTTYLPPISPTGAEVQVVCDDSGNVVSISNQPSWALYQYNYNITIFEERHNILSFIGGNCGMMYAR